MSGSRVQVVTTRALFSFLFAASIACASAGGTAEDDKSDTSDFTDDTDDADTTDESDQDGIDAAVVVFIDAATGVIDASTPIETIDAAPGVPDAAPPVMIDAAVPTCTTCKLIAQTCCATNQACDLINFQGGTSCRAVTPPPGGTETSTCTAAASCAPGYSCYGPTTAERTCQKYCSADSQCAGGGNQGGKCVIEILGAGSAQIPNTEHPQNRTFTCSPNCNPQATTGCPTGFACEVNTFNPFGTFVDYTECRKAGTVALYGDCTPTATGGNDCMAGSTCIDTGDPQPICLKYCKVGAASTGCGLFESCRELQDNLNSPFVIGGTTWGVCF